MAGHYNKTQSTHEAHTTFSTARVLTYCTLYKYQVYNAVN